MHRLCEYEAVTLTLPDNGVLECHVLAMAGTTVALEPVSRALAARLPEKVCDVFLVKDQGGSFLGYKGVLFQRGAVGDLRFKVADATPRADRRGATRVATCTPVSIRRASGEVTCGGVTVDLSADGLLVGGVDPLPVGEQVEVLLLLPGSDHDPLTARATVVRSDAAGVALRLGEGAHEARLRLAQFVVERNRAILQRRREVLDLDAPDF